MPSTPNFALRRRIVPRLRGRGFAWLLVLAACAACATAPPVEAPVPARIDLVDVRPAIGSRIDAETEIRVRAAYSMPPSAVGSHAVLMFVTEQGIATAAGHPQHELETSAGIIEFTARPADVYGTLRRPLTAVVVLMSRPDLTSPMDTIDRTAELPPAVRRRIAREAGDPVADGGRIRVRSVAIGQMRPLARSRAIFYNGAGPAGPIRLPPLPFEQMLEEYMTYRGNKALAVAVDDAGRRSWGYGFGFELADSAVTRALRECDERVQRRGVHATCRLHAVGNVIVER